MFPDAAPSADASLSENLFSDSVSPDALQSLKEDARTCLGDAFYLRLEDVENIYCRAKAEDDGGGAAQRQQQQFARFLDVVIRRLKRLTSLHL